VSGDPSSSDSSRAGTQADQPAPGRTGLWSLDEYVVVADLYLRRGRSSGVNDPEVIELARLTGRTTASISRRLGNFDGTARPGMGLKPVTGEAREVFTAMQTDPVFRDRIAREARARLATTSQAVAGGRAAPRFVDPEDFQVETVDAVPPATTRELQRIEGQLVRRYRAWLDPQGRRLKGLIIPVGDVMLRADLFDTELQLLIEAKAAATREHVRYAVGQLLDYRRYLTPRPALALLLPRPLESELAALPYELDIGIIWAAGAGFTDSVDGRLTVRAETGRL
jgi:hypothetical protein